jgi:hypothetical protein
MPSKYRTYTRSKSTEPYRVKTWSNRRCEKCNQFIGGQKQKLCEKCYEEKHSLQTELNHIERRNAVQAYGMETIRELTEFPLTRELSSNLRNYV